MTQTYKKADPIWCAGCGHFGVQSAMQYAIKNSGVPLHDIFVLAGIGCSGSIQNNIGVYGYHAMHGRVLPTAIGASLANPDLTVIAAGGDGDGYAIGAGHLMHALKRNPNLLYVVMNNGVYGLTKGQDSPTMEDPQAAPTEQPLDAMMLGLAIQGSTFLARAITTHSTQLNKLMSKGLQHALDGKGMALVEVLSPCVTYNDTYPEWMKRTHDVDSDSDYQANDRGQAFMQMQTLTQQSKLPVGLIYQGDHPSLQDGVLKEVTPIHALKKNHSKKTDAYIKSVLSNYIV